MFARRPTAEVLPGDKDRGLGVARRMQHEIGDLLSVARKAPIVKQEFAKSRALDALQKLLGDDLIGIHVDAIERGDDTGMFAKWLHKSLLCCPCSEIRVRGRNDNFVICPCILRNRCATTPCRPYRRPPPWAVRLCIGPGPSARRRRARAGSPRRPLP